jgi:arsenate reductase-like glutaredoxin family protein
MTFRWTPHRKMAVVDDILAAKITPPEACAKHGLSREELAEWMAAYGRGGTKALRAANQTERELNRAAVAQAKG